MELKTDRLLLREFTPNDLEAIYAYESDPVVVKYVCYGPSSKNQCEQELAFHIAQQSMQPRVYYHLALILHRQNRLIGWCGLKIANPTNREAELGYALHCNYWGQGYATEAAATLLGFGFQHLHLHRIVATCHPDNQGSIGVLEKLGMSFEGCLRQQRWCKDDWRSTNFYSILEHEWHTPLYPH